MTKEIKIKKGWYYSAGRTYGWTYKYAPEGVGLNRELFDSDKIIVDVKGQKYELDSKEGLEFIRKHKAFKMIGTAKVGFVPRELMKKL